jgi:outer membrane protein assembly factor BamB
VNRRAACALTAVALVAAALVGTADSAASDVSTAIGSPGTFFPLAPARILDTRTTHSPVGPNSTINVQAVGQGGVPAIGVSAVVVNLTATQPTAVSYLTAYPTGSTPPVASNLNFGPGQTIPNLVVVKLGNGGRFSIYNAQGYTHVLADVVGWYSDGSGEPGGRYTPLSPARILDTRTTQTPVGPGSTIDVSATDQGGVPVAGVTAVVVNLTATDSTAGSYLTAYPTGALLPVASNLNFGPGQTIPNLVVVKLGSDGKFSLYNAQGFTHVVVDIVGYFYDSSISVGDPLTALPATRILDTRTSDTAVGPGKSIDVQGSGVGGVPSSGVSAVVVNLTATEPTAGSYLTAFPTGGVVPLTSNLNFGPGQTIANLVVVKLGPEGKFSIYNAQGFTHVVADVVGWLQIGSAPGAAVAYQRDIAHTGGGADPAFPSQPGLLWDREMGGAVGYPLIAGGRAFVTVANSQPGASTVYGSKLYALDEHTGNVLWVADLEGMFSFSAAAYEAGRVFAINHDGVLRAFDAVTGTPLWMTMLPDGSVPQFLTAPTAHNGFIYTSGFGNGGTVYAVRETDGALLWTQSVLSGMHSSPAVSDLGVYVSYACEQTYDLLPATGTLLWHHAPSCYGGGGLTPALYGGRLYVRDEAGMDPAILDALTGFPQGSFAAGPIPAFSKGRGFFVHPLLGPLEARDVITGATLWQDESSFSSAPIVVNDAVFVGDLDGVVHGIGASDGIEFWSAGVGAPILPPDEHNAVQLTGLAEGGGVLLVPASSTLVAFG